MSVWVKSCNVNMYSSREERRETILSVAAEADVLLLQEVKWDDVARILGKDWHVHQDTSSEARAGVAVAWRKTLGEAKQTGHRLGVKAGKAAMLDRWIAYVDLVIEGCVVRFASTHRPPARYAYLWRRFDRHLKTFVNNSRVPVLVGIDGNKKLALLGRALGLNPKGRGIVGLLTDKRLDLSPARYQRTNSDHLAVGTILRLAICPCCGRKLTISGE